MMKRNCAVTAAFILLSGTSLACSDEANNKKEAESSHAQEPSTDDQTPLIDRDNIFVGDNDSINGAMGGGSSDDRDGFEFYETAPDEFYVTGSSKGALGGWKMVGILDGEEQAEQGECKNVLRGLARDFRAAHSDFEGRASGLLTGIISDGIGDDKKPIFIGQDNDQIENRESFDQWYRNVEGVNLPYLIDFWLEPVGDTFVFDSAAYFPLVGIGYATQECEGCNGQKEGFHFTTELHTTFRYRGGESFAFRGDDDVWVFLNGALVMDLGGVHTPVEGEILIDELSDELGLALGETYPLDMFHAERRTTESNFRIETTLDFASCGTVLPDDVIVR